MGLSDRALRELMRILETGRVPSDESAASDLYYAVREALESRSLLQATRDAMRILGEELEQCRIDLAEARRRQ
jgi:hypothetical protein